MDSDNVQLPDTATPWHALDADTALAQLASGVEGLSADEAEARRERWGANVLQAEAGIPLWRVALDQILNPLILMLLAAALVSALVGEHLVDAAVILIVVVFNTVIGVVQEWRAEQALEALRKMAAPRARVLRNDMVATIPAEEVVPGDVLVLEAGDRVAADARLLEAHDLFADESALTGESLPVEKSPATRPANTPLADRANMVWTTTAITNGRARAMVTATAMRTVIGEIAGEVRGTKRADTPLQRRIGRLGTLLGVLAVALALGVFLLGLARGFPLVDMLLFAVATAVSAIPEGLPAVIGVVLALGVQRMAKRHAIVRRLPAVETLGSTTVICTDKTGTLTRNEMTVTRVWAGERVYRISGDGYTMAGSIEADGDAPTPAETEGRDLLLAIGVLASDAHLAEMETGAWRVEGDPTEGALVVAARKGGIHPTDLRTRCPRMAELPFSSQAQYMATLQHTPERLARIAVKGAPERVLSFCTHIRIAGARVPLSETHRAAVVAAGHAFADDALRVLAGAYADLPEGTADLTPAHIEAGLTFVGLWGLLDPPRQEAIAAVNAAQAAGIRVVMITGDHRATARAIAQRVGIAGPDDEVVDGVELDAISDDDLPERAANIAVYARVPPSGKLRIVKALQARGQVVGMTGDGVNDAPALKRADIGIAMGRTGTEVAKEAADMVLADDNFATIVAAVEEGRVIFSNLRKVIFFLVTTNLGEVLTLTAALLLGLNLPLTAVMILWVNLVTDGVLTIPVGIEKGHGDALKSPPRDPSEGVFDRWSLVRMLCLAPVMATGTLLLFAYASRGGDEAVAQTIAFTTLVAFQWFHALNARSHQTSTFALSLRDNPWMLGGIGVAVLLQLAVIYIPFFADAFHTAPLTLPQWGAILLTASTILLADELLKLGWRMWQRGRT